MPIRYLLLSFLCFAVVLGPGCRQEQEKSITPSGNTVRIGVIASLTGDDRELGEGALPGIQLALKVDPYLKNGDKVELLIRDDGSVPERSVEIAKEFAHDESVSAVLLVSKSQSGLEVAKEADALKIPILAVLSSHPGVTNNEWISQIIFNDETQGIVAALYVMDELLVEETTAFRDRSDPHSVFLTETFALKYREAGGKVRIIDVPPGNPDLEQLITGLAEPFQSFFYAPVEAEAVLRIEKITRENDLAPRIMLSDGLLSWVLLAFEEDIRLLDGMLATDVYSTKPERTAYGRKMSEIFRKDFDQTGTTYTALGCEGTSYLLEALEMCSDNGDRSCIRDSIRSGEEFIGFAGGMRITSQGEAERPVYINRIVNGEMQSLVKIY